MFKKKLKRKPDLFIHNTQSRDVIKKKPVSQTTLDLYTLIQYIKKKIFLFNISKTHEPFWYTFSYMVVG